MSTNPLLALETLGQSVWLDYIRRHLLTSGELARYTFGIVKSAQARGDFEVFAARGRRLLRVHLGTDVLAGLERLKTLVSEALA
jgi:hypothetical protein